jgi:predicted phosphodiesterase
VPHETHRKASSNAGLLLSYLASVKILAVSDPHGNPEHFAWISKQRADLILLAGDIASIDEDRDRARAWLLRLPVPAAICSGNHDWDYGDCRWLYELRHGRLLVDQAGCLSGIPIVALPWPTADDDAWLEGCRAAKRIGKLKLPWILLSHTPPAGSGLAARDGDFEALALDLADCIRPRVAVCGHWHNCPGVWRSSTGSLWINPGQSSGAVPNHAWISWREGHPVVRLVEHRSIRGHRARDLKYTR